MNEGIKKETIIRTIVLFIVMINNILILCGMNPLPFSEDQLYENISAIVTVLVTLWAWWKNNSFTKKAVKADKYKDSL